MPAAGSRSNSPTTIDNKGLEGEYWSSSLYEESCYARGISVVSTGSDYYNRFRCMGRTIRPVRK